MEEANDSREVHPPTKLQSTTVQGDWQEGMNMGIVSTTLTRTKQNYKEQNTFWENLTG